MTNATLNQSTSAASSLADVFAGITVALVAIPQCMAFATVAGLPAASGLYAAVAMGLVSAVISRSPRLVVGPAITASTMTFAILRTSEPDEAHWPAMAGALAILVGLFTILGAVLNIGRFVRFVSRSVIVGLMAGSAILTIGTQLAPALGIDGGNQSTLVGVLWHTLRHAANANVAALLMAIGTLALAMLSAWIGPRFPAAFLALIVGATALWLIRSTGTEVTIESIGRLDWRIPHVVPPGIANPYRTDFLVGAAAIALVGVIQSLAIAKALAARSAAQLETKRELWSLGAANIVAGLVHGFPGSGSFARSALCDMAGAQTRLAGIVAAIATAAIVTLAAPLAELITRPAIAGLLVATAISMVDWREFLHVLTRDRHDRVVLATTIVGVLVVPIHWAILLGLTVSVAVFLRRVSELHLFEMVGDLHRPFREKEIDAATGHSAITMLQIEGPLFFAHADELAETLRAVFARRPLVTILRMRRTQQIDFSVLKALDHAVAEYRRGGGYVVICGLSADMRAALLASPLGATVGSDFLLETTREVFGSAHQAIGLALSIVDASNQGERPLFRPQDTAA